jgi:adenosylmethionine-8-amino-7-oxononanoate aminotransferase
MSGANRKSWVERDAAVVWHGSTQMAAYGDNAPLVVDRAEGRELIDADGHVLFAADGTVAVEQALKIAFQYWVNRGVEGRTAF